MIPLSCAEVRRELSNHIEQDVTPALRALLEEHLRHCSMCRAVFDGVRNMMVLVKEYEIIELRQGFSRRLYRRLIAERT